MLFDRGTCWVLPLTYLYLPESARAYLFPQSVKTHYFCSGPISFDPICPQPNGALEASLTTRLLLQRRVSLLDTSVGVCNVYDVCMNVCMYVCMYVYIYIYIERER